MIVLVGFMGAGKTTVGRILAARIGVPFRDTDAMVVAEAGATIEDIFNARGEPAFRELEREAAYEALSEGGVVSLGGGALGDPGIVAHLERSDVVHLDVTYGEAMRRVGGDRGRPMLTGDSRALFREREQMYRAVAEQTVSTNGRDPEDIAREIAEHFGLLPDEDWDRVRVQLDDRSYDVVVGRDAVGSLADLLPPMPGADKAFVVTHPSLHQYVDPVLVQLDKAGLSPTVFFLPEGERAKSLDAIASLYEKLAENEAHRHDLFVTFGGGAISDAGGYAASTFARGMPLLHIPTTLLAQVDASIGGKTAVNLPHAKNLVGTIYQPALVVADVSLLATCPQEEIRSGLAEVIKYGFIADPALLDTVTGTMDEILAADPAVLARIVTRCAAIKAEIVSTDETESGVRAHLNYGHTFGHAIEKMNAYSGVRHGEAVAVGMMAAAYLSEELGRIDRQVVDLHRSVLSAAGLPVTASLDLAELEDAWRLDKKYKKGVRFVVLAGLGRPEAGVEVPRPAILRTVERLRS